MKSMEWNWWGHEAGVGSSSSVELQREMEKMSSMRIEKVMGLVAIAEAIAVFAFEEVSERRTRGRYVCGFLLINIWCWFNNFIVTLSG